MESNQPERRSEYNIVSAILTSGRISEGVLVDLKYNISQFEIYESINKPYVTAKIFLLDHNNLIQGLDFSGGEKITLTIAHSEEEGSGFEIKKEFLIDRIESIVKTDERTEAVIFHCIEYHMFGSSLQNISRCYKGSPSSMIEKILIQYLNKEVAILGEDVRNNLKVIIPNLSPIEACMWLKNKVVTRGGLPSYLFSAMGLDNLVLKSLEEMLTQVPINLEVPFIYAPSITVNVDEFPKFYTIDEFNVAGTEDLLTLIRDGFVGADYQFYDTSTGLPTPVKFDIENVFRSLSDDVGLGGSNSRFVYGSEYKYNDKKISTYDSKVVTQISSNGAYNSNTSFNSYNHEVNEGDHRKKINAAALQNFLGKSPIEITVRSREFLTGDGNYTIGKTIRIVFLDNTEEDQTQLTLDNKKSGDHIICGARHTFSGNSASTQLLCGKLGYFGQEFEL